MRFGGAEPHLNNPGDMEAGADGLDETKKHFIFLPMYGLMEKTTLVCFFFLRLRCGDRYQIHVCALRTELESGRA